MSRNKRMIVACILALASSLGSLVTVVVAKFALWPMVLCVILAVAAAIIVPKTRRLGPCNFCKALIPEEEAYCNDVCLHAHVDQAIKKHMAERRPFPPPDKHGPHCCCIYC